MKEYIEFKQKCAIEAMKILLDNTSKKNGGFFLSKDLEVIASNAVYLSNEMKKNFYVAIR